MAFHLSPFRTQVLYVGFYPVIRYLSRSQRLNKYDSKDRSMDNYYTEEVKLQQVNGNLTEAVKSILPACQ